MKEKYGVLLLDKAEIIIRIYETNQKEWKLLYYQSMELPPRELTTDTQASPIIETIAEFLVSDYAQNVIEWRTCARNISDTVIRDVASSTNFRIENLTLLREQELLCKGMFTELW